jgi:hypothetical protein
VERDQSWHCTGAHAIRRNGPDDQGLWQSSFVHVAFCEPKGKWKESLSKWVEHYRKEDPRRLYASGTGHTEREVPNLTEGTEYLAIQCIGQLMLRRESGWFGADYGQSLVDMHVPVVSHDVGQWVAYPDFDIIKKFKGYMRPGNYENLPRLTRCARPG